MRTPKLTDAEFDDLTEALSRFRDERAMNLEELDRFIAALICGPSTIPPSEFLSEIWGGGEMADAESFASEEDIQRAVISCGCSLPAGSASKRRPAGTSCWVPQALARWVTSTTWPSRRSGCGTMIVA